MLPALQAAAQSEFPVQDLTTPEKRFLQAALTLEGHYDALLDGAWGPASRTALRSALRARGNAGADADAVGAIARDAARILRDQGWGVLRELGGRASYLLPLGQMDTRPSGETGTVYISKDGMLRASDFTSGLGDAQALHQRIRTGTRLGAEVYALDRDSMRVTATTLREGRRVYLRSISSGGGRWVSLLVEWQPDNAGAARSARLIAASFQLGAQDLPVAGRGALRAAMRGEAPANRPAPQPPTVPGGGSGQGLDALLQQLLAELGRGSDPADPEDIAEEQRAGWVGIGFYVNNTDFVTLTSVVKACGRRGMALGDDTRARRLEGGDALGVTLLTSRKRSAHWLPVSDAGVNLSARSLRAVTVAKGGWRTGTAQQVTPRLLGTLDLPGAKGQVFAAMTAGKRNLGAPILDDRGAVIGIATGAPDLSGLPDRARRELTRVSGIMQAPDLPGVLARSGIAFQRSAPPARLYRLDPDKAVVALKCRAG